MTCPEGWRIRDGYRACGYCGSMHPDDLFKCIDAGAMITGTDKNYKIYVDAPSVDPEMQRVVSTSSDDEMPTWGRGWQRTNHDNVHLLARDGWAGSYKWIMVQPIGPTTHCKFYFYHFNEAHMVRFIELYNTKKLNLEPMFGLYRMPFFMRRATAGDTQ
jgi:hypothetical protein